MVDIKWALTEKVTMKEENAGNVYTVRRSGKPDMFTISFHEGRTLINFAFQDLGDDHIGILSLIDEFHELGGFPGRTVVLSAVEM